MIQLLFIFLGLLLVGTGIATWRGKFRYWRAGADSPNPDFLMYLGILVMIVGALVMIASYDLTNLVIRLTIGE